MLPNQTAAIVNLEIFDDVIPEIDETFNVTISNPVGGATLGGQIKVPVTILSNDDAHGRIGFDEVHITNLPYKLPSDHYSDHHSDHYSNYTITIAIAIATTSPLLIIYYSGVVISYSNRTRW